MSDETDNHEYATPSQGTEDWHEPLNANFEELDVDVEVRDVAANRDAYDPNDGAKFLELDTGIVYVGDGEEWAPALAMAYYTADGELECGALAECFEDATGDSEGGPQAGASTFGENAHAIHDGAVVFGDSTRRGIWSESLDEIRSQMPFHAPSVYTPGAAMGQDGLEARSVNAESLGAVSLTAGALQADVEGLTVTMADAPALDVGNDAISFGIGADEGVVTIQEERVESELPIHAPEFETTSASALKTAVEPVDTGAVLDRVQSLPITTWEFRAGDGARHMGPMAEAFDDAFGLGSSTESIATVDADGVAFAAIQGLATRLTEETERLRDSLAERDARIETLESETSDLRERLAALESRLDQGIDDAADSGVDTPIEADD